MTMCARIEVPTSGCPPIHAYHRHQSTTRKGPRRSLSWHLFIGISIAFQYLIFISAISGHPFQQTAPSGQGYLQYEERRENDSSEVALEKAARTVSATLKERQVSFIPTESSSFVSLATSAPSISSIVESLRRTPVSNPLEISAPFPSPLNVLFNVPPDTKPHQWTNIPQSNNGNDPISVRPLSNLSTEDKSTDAPEKQKEGNEAPEESHLLVSIESPLGDHSEINSPSLSSSIHSRELGPADLNLSATNKSNSLSSQSSGEGTTGRSLNPHERKILEDEQKRNPLDKSISTILDVTQVQQLFINNARVYEEFREHRDGNSLVVLARDSDVVEFNESDGALLKNWRLLPLNSSTNLSHLDVILQYLESNGGEIFSTKPEELVNWNLAKVQQNQNDKEKKKEEDQKLSSFILWCPWHKVIIVGCSGENKLAVGQTADELPGRRKRKWRRGKLANTRNRIRLQCKRNETKSNFELDQEQDFSVMLLTWAEVCLMPPMSSKGEGHWNEMEGRGEADSVRTKRDSMDSEHVGNVTEKGESADTGMSVVHSKTDSEEYQGSIEDGSTSGGVSDVTVSKLNVTSRDVRNTITEMSVVSDFPLEGEEEENHEESYLSTSSPLVVLSTPSAKSTSSYHSHSINRVFESSRGGGRGLPNESSVLQSRNDSYQAIAEPEDKSGVTKVSVLGLFELSTRTGMRPEGQSELAAAQMAIKHINARSLLPGYSLEMLTNDTEVSGRGSSIDKSLNESD